MPKKGQHGEPLRVIPMRSVNDCDSTSSQECDDSEADWWEVFDANDTSVDSFGNPKLARRAVDCINALDGKKSLTLHALLNDIHELIDEIENSGPRGRYHVRLRSDKVKHTLFEFGYSQ
jgi:hypothetical protein